MIVTWLRGQWSWVSFIAGLITTKVAEFAFDRFKIALVEGRDRNKFRRFLYQEVADNYNRLDDAIREYDASEKNESAPTVDGILISTDRYREVRKDLMRFGDLGQEGRAIEVVYSSLSAFRGMGNSERNWAIAKVTKKSIEEDLRRKILDSKLLIEHFDNSFRKEELRAILRSCA